MSKGTKVAPAEIVSDGRNVRWTLERAQVEADEKVRIDWLRITFPLGSISRRDESLPVNLDVLALMDRKARERDFACRTSSGGEDYTGPMYVAASGARQLCERFELFEVGSVDDVPKDFYLARAAIMFEGSVVGHCLAGGKTAAQASTVHFDLHGAACLHLSHAKWLELKQWARECAAHITRVDVALDLFDGIDMPSVQKAWHNGEFDVRGKRPSQREIGSWSSGHSRTFQVGTRETGKLCRVYEKGDQLFGHEAADPWVRVECEFRHNQRVIDLDVLSHPSQYFAGAYEFCAQKLSELQAEVQARRIPTVARLVSKTVEAAVDSCVRFLSRTAGPSLARVFWDGGDLIASIVQRESHRVPKRFTGFKRADIALALEKVAFGFAPPIAPFAAGAI